MCTHETNRIKGGSVYIGHIEGLYGGPSTPSVPKLHHIFLFIYHKLEYQYNSFALAPKKPSYQIVMSIDWLKGWQNVSVFQSVNIIIWWDSFGLTHWGQVMHVCISKLTIIGSDNGLLPGRRQAIIWTNTGILFIGPLGTKFNSILIEIHTFSFKKMHLEKSYAKWRPFCLGLNVLGTWLKSEAGHKNCNECILPLVDILENNHTLWWSQYHLFIYWNSGCHLFKLRR